MAKKTKPTIIFEKLESLKVNESFNKKEFIIEHWGDYNYFIDRSFSVAFTGAKKKLMFKTFKTKTGIIKRIK